MAWCRMWKIGKFLAEHPRLSMGMYVVGCIPVANVLLKRRAANELMRPVYDKLEVGSNPRVPLGRNDNIIPRPELLDKMKMVIGLSQSDVDHDEVDDDDDDGKGFSVIVGPSGTGKTVAVTHICNQSPRGVLYFEVVSANSFTFDIAKEIGMKVAPSGIIDLILGYISHSYKLYHEVPEDKDRSLATVMNILHKAAEKFYAKHGKMPFLFIDGIDILAKKDEELVTCLLSHAKYLSNHNILKVVLISSNMFLTSYT